MHPCEEHVVSGTRVASKYLSGKASRAIYVISYCLTDLPVKRDVPRQMEKGGEDDEAAACAEDEEQAAAGPALASAFAAAIDARTRSSAPSPDAAKHTS